MHRNTLKKNFKILDFLPWTQFFYRTYKSFYGAEATKKLLYVEHLNQKKTREA